MVQLSLWLTDFERNVLDKERERERERGNILSSFHFFPSLVFFFWVLEQSGEDLRFIEWGTRSNWFPLFFSLSFWFFWEVAGNLVRFIGLCSSAKVLLFCSIFGVVLL